MIWIIIALGIFIFILAKYSTPKPTNQNRIEITIPNPNKCSDKTFFDFVKKTQNFKLEAILEELDSKNIYLKPVYRRYIHDKINNIHIDYTATTIGDSENSIYIELKGVHLKNRKSYILENCVEGDLVELIPEADNEYDSKAVMVKRFGKLLGYLDKGLVNSYHLKSHLIKKITIATIDYDESNEYLFVEILIDFFSESSLDLHSEFEELKTNKISRKYLYPKKDIDNKSNYFYGKKVVITGTFNNFPFRNEIAMMLWEVGADVDTAISKRTDIMLIGNNGGWRKQEYADINQIECIDETIFMSYFPNYKPKFN